MKNHVTAILKALNVTNRTEAVIKVSETATALLAFASTISGYQAFDPITSAHRTAKLQDALCPRASRRHDHSTSVLSRRSWFCRLSSGRPSPRRAILADSSVVVGLTEDREFASRFLRWLAWASAGSDGHSGPPTSFRSPWQNSHVERLIGSIRRECTTFDCRNVTSPRWAGGEAAGCGLLRTCRARAGCTAAVSSTPLRHSRDQLNPDRVCASR